MPLKLKQYASLLPAVFLFTVGLLATATACAQGEATEPNKTNIYKKVDANGRVTFTDAAIGQSEVVTVTTPNIARPSQLSGSSLPTRKLLVPVEKYTRCDISSPQPETTLRNDEASRVTLTVTISPGLQPTHKIQFFVDGKKFGNAGVQSSQQITDLPRGAHTVTANVLSDAGAVLCATGARTFYMQKTSRLLPIPQKKMSKSTPAKAI